MTTKEYCKLLAEVNNDLKFQTKQSSTKRVVTRNNKEQLQQGLSLDCATGLLDNASQVDPPNCELPPLRMGGGGGGDAMQSQYDRVVEAKQGATTTSGLISSSGGYSSNGDTQIGSSDHVYPNGWLPVMESAKVKAGEIKRAIIMGRDIIVTRSREGQVNVLDAYCPHMGVNIGVGGRVLRVDNQSCVQCPFHGWTFRASDGECVSVPYVNKRSNCTNNQSSKYGGTSIPKQARLNNWLCNEVDDFIYIWHHIDGQAPSWQLEATPELASGQFIVAGRSCHKSNLEMRDMHENGADMNHFEGIHNDLFVFGGKFLQVQAWNYIQRYSRHHWSPDWMPILNDDGKSTHMAEMSLKSWISVYKMRVFDIEVRATQIGPACVSLRYKSKWYGSGVLKMNAIPLGGRRTLYVQHIYTEKSIFNWLMAKWVLFGEIMQVSSISINISVAGSHLYIISSIIYNNDL